MNPLFDTLFFQFEFRCICFLETSFNLATNINCCKVIDKPKGVSDSDFFDSGVKKNELTKK